MSQFTFRDQYEGEEIIMDCVGLLTYDPKVIVDGENKVVGYIWFKMNGNEMTIDMIEVIRKEKGIGTQVIRDLFDHHGVDRIIGETLSEESERAYYFWLSLGAVFASGEVWDHLNPSRDQVPFTLEM